MQFHTFTPAASMLALNVVVASIVLGFAAIIVAFLVRRSSLSLRHGILCVALVLTLASPLPIWIASNQGFGVVPISVVLPDREASLDLDSVPPTTRGGETDVPVQEPDSFDDGGMHEMTAAHDAALLSAVDRKTQTSGSGNDLMAAGLSGATPVAHQSLLSLQTVRQVGALLAAVWAVVAVWLLLRLARGLLVIRSLRRSLRPTTDPRLIKAATRLTSGRTACASLCESHLAPAPLTLGWWRSVIVMPVGLAELLNDDELESVLAHEAAHVARHDTVIAMLQQLSVVGFWWNPLLRVVNRQINQLRERICDDHVVKQFGDGLPLARALVKVAEWSSGCDVVVPLASTLLDGDDDIGKRITWLAKRDRPALVGLTVRSAAMLGLFGILLAVVPLVPAMRAQDVAVPRRDAAAADGEPRDTETPETTTRAPATSDAATSDPAPSEAGWRVRIRTVDADGKTITNPRIGIKLGGDGEQNWHDGDGDGWFTATLPTRTPRYCYFLARAQGYAPMRAFWRNGVDKAEEPLPAEFTFEMTQAITVGGTVVDEDNQPISGATVLFSAGADAPNIARRAKTTFYREKYTTDERGRWRCDLAPESMSHATINVSHADYALDHRNYGLAKQIESLRALKHRWPLKKGFAVTGRVVAADGSPIAGATLALCELNSASREGPFERTDADGRYRFERVSPGLTLPRDDDPIRFTISIIKSGFAPAMESVPGYGKRPLANSTEQERIVDFTLRPGVPLTLRVVDSQNRPIEGAWILPDEWRYTGVLAVLQKFGIPGETDAQGVWRWNHAPAGEKIGYDVLKRGFADVRDHYIDLADQAVEETIVLKRPQVIVGTVIGLESKKPIADFIVQRAFEEMSGYPDGLWWTGSTRGKNGQYRKQVTLPPHNGSYTYRVLAEGYKPAVSKSTPFTEGETRINFELQRDAPKPAAPAKSGASRAADAREARLAEVEPEFNKIYKLDEKEERRKTRVLFVER